MNRTGIMELVLDNWNKPVVFVDRQHVIRYMNRPARVHYAKWGDVIGKSIFDCHNPESGRIIRESYEKLMRGEEEVLITDSPKHRVYMRGVFDPEKKLAGYYERYEPPKGS